MNELQENGAVPFQKLLLELVILIVGSLAVSALLTPPLYRALESLAGEALWPYSRVFDRVIMVVAVVFFLLRRRHYDITYYRTSISDLLKPPRVKPLAIGFFLSFVFSLLALPIVVSSGTLVWEENPVGVILWRFFKTLPAAGLISLIEETFFRFFLFLSLRRYMSFIWAAGLSSCFYAVVHFIQPVKTWELPEEGIFAGFEYLSLLLDRFTYAGFLEAAFGLFLVGVVLCFTVERTRSLLPAIGLHAGWVTTTKVIGKLVGAAEWFEYPAGSGRRYYLLTHEFTWLTICLVGVLTLFVFVKSSGSKGREDG